MSISHTSRRSTDAEIVAEMDRRGVVIEKLEAEIERLTSALDIEKARNAALFLGTKASALASPSAGSISAEDLERAAEAVFNARPHNHPQGQIPQWSKQPESIKNVDRRYARAAFEAAGLTVAPDGEK